MFALLLVPVVDQHLLETFADHGAVEGEGLAGRAGAGLHFLDAGNLPSRRPAGSQWANGCRCSADPCSRP